MPQIITSEHIRQCPLCESNDLVKDYVREETYCNHCGLVISSSANYVGLEKIDYTTPHSPMAEARNKVHYSWVDEKDKAKINNRKTTKYKHRIPNRKLMIKGYKGR